MIVRKSLISHRTARPCTVFFFYYFSFFKNSVTHYQDWHSVAQTFAFGIKRKKKKRRAYSHFSHKHNNFSHLRRRDTAHHAKSIPAAFSAVIMDEHIAMVLPSASCKLRITQKKSTHIDIIASSLNSIFRKYLFSWSHSTFCVCSARFRIKLWNVFKCEVFCVNLLPREITWLLQAAPHPFFSGLTERIMSRVWRIGFRACLILSIHFYWSITRIRDVWFLFSLSLCFAYSTKEEEKQHFYEHTCTEWMKKTKRAAEKLRYHLNLLLHSIQMQTHTWILVGRCLHTTVSAHDGRTKKVRRQR